MLVILGRKTSSNVQKVLWCCGELGLPFERRDYGGEFANTKTPEYLALNPNALVPTILDDGFVLWESNAIVRYLAMKHGRGGLWPDDPQVAAGASRWMDWQLTMVQPPAGILMRALLLEQPYPPAEVESARQRAVAAWTILDAQLAKTRYVAGEALTVGDIAFGNVVHRWHKFRIEKPPLPHLDAWYRGLCDRPAYREHIASL